MSFLLKIVIAAMATGVVLVSGALLFSARPTPLIGLDGDALAHSVPGSIGACREITGGEWTCAVEDGKRKARYRVDVDWAGCWEGEVSGASIPGQSPRMISGCIDIWDHLRIEDKLNASD